MTHFKFAISTMKVLLLLVGTGYSLAASPDGPSQQCRDDAGPPWQDDAETFGTNAYSAGAPALPALDTRGQCPPPLAGACADKTPQRAFLEGPVQCGGKGWFCRIIDQDGWSNPDYNDRNFAHCNATDADQRDNDGHCHGSDVDNVYGWWVRDHWFRGYAGTLHCCCDWEGVKGLTNRCDYRKEVKPFELDNCRDANEEHNKGYEGSCAAYSNIPFQEPVGSSDQCWTMYNFAAPDSVLNPNPILSAPPATTGTTTVMPSFTSSPSLSPPSSVNPGGDGNDEEDEDKEEDDDKEEEEEEDNKEEEEDDDDDEKEEEDDEDGKDDDDEEEEEEKEEEEEEKEDDDEKEEEEDEEKEEDKEEDCDDEDKEGGEGEDGDKEWHGSEDNDMEWHEEEGEHEDEDNWYADEEKEEGSWHDDEHHEEREEGYFDDYWRGSDAFKHWFRQRIYSSANKRGRV
jgi:hypothetical protein